MCRYTFNYVRDYKVQWLYCSRHVRIYVYIYITHICTYTYTYRRALEVKYPCTDAPMHGLINNIDTNAKFCHKKLTCKWTLRQVFIRVYRLEIQSVTCWYFRPSFVTCSCCPLTPSLWVNPPPPPPPPPRAGVRQIKTCRKVSFKVNFI